jgi:hypothetical protein
MVIKGWDRANWVVQVGVALEYGIDVHYVLHLTNLT